MEALPTVADGPTCGGDMHNGWMVLLPLLAAGAALPQPRLSTGETLKAWEDRVRASTGQGTWQLIRELDPKFEPDEESLTDGDGNHLPVARVEHFAGQLDADPEPEIVVQVVLHGPFEVNGERPEAYWIGILDQAHDDSHRYRLAASLHEVVEHCNWDEKKLGLTFGFTRTPTPALWVERQLTSACGTMVSFEFHKTEYRLAQGTLKATEVPAREGMDYDRIRTLQETGTP